MSIYDRDLLIVDGACGTNLQEMSIPAGAWEGREGCNELLNLTAPAVIRELHAGFVDAGAMILETNTFGASRVVLAEYDLQDHVREINIAAVANARTAAEARPGVFVAGSLGPTTKLPTLGHIDVGDLETAYREQADALLEGGVDLLILETCQDLLQIKTALVAVFAALDSKGLDLPVMVSITMERTGTMLLGTDTAAAAVTVAPFPVFSLGLNCATGPAEMESYVRYLSQNWDRRISCIPNQGLPEVVDGRTCYRLTPAEYAGAMRRFVAEFGVSIVGGCCGTTPDHIRALVHELEGVTPARREVSR